MQNTVIECVRSAGELVLRQFGKCGGVSHKGNSSNIVTAADFASEKLIIEIIRRAFPDHNVLGEESGIVNHGSDFTWVVDPLDGTSNFAAGLPWFGVMVAILKHSQPLIAAMYLPVTDVLYFSERGKGVLRNGKPARMTLESELGNTLCSYGLDATASADELEQQTRFMRLLVTRARNVRLTNCLLDFCNTLDGHYGACINQHCKIWDIAPACLMFPEAGGCFTDLQGREIRLELDPAKYLRNYAIVGANPVLHRQVVALAGEAGF